jgi:hypothetical protein
VIAMINAHIRAADRGTDDLHENLIRSRDRGGYFFNSQVPGTVIRKGKHGYLEL